MKKHYFPICAAFTMFSLFATLSYAFEPTNEFEVALYNARLIPAPKSIEYGKGVVIVNDKLSCSIVLPQAEIESPATQQFLAKLSADVRNRLNVKFTPETCTAEALLSARRDKANGDEHAFLLELVNQNEFWTQKCATRILALSANDSVNLSVRELIAKRDELTGRLIVVGSDLDGVRNAFKTLLQLTESIGNTNSLMTSRYFIPEIRVEDSPALKFRGLHLCWFPETDPTRIEQSIRIASYYKFNYIVLEFWGTFPFECNPSLTWAEHHTSKSEIARLVKLGKNLGITLIPQLNLFGHATGSRVSVGKHTTLDLNPMQEPLFEPDGWTWNIYNAETREMLTKCVLELYEVFDSPEYFHIGFDEAYSAGTSLEARRSGNYVDVLADWIKHFHEVFKKRNCRLMMWHDMMIEAADFNGYVVGAKAETRGLINKIPKDIIVCDWQYGTPRKDETWPTVDYFVSNGFELLTCPWTNVEGIRSLSKKTIEKNCTGTLYTTWHKFYGQNMRNILIEGALSAWGVPYRAAHSEKIGTFNRHLRQASFSIQNKTYRTGGDVDWQVPNETIGP